MSYDRKTAGSSPQTFGFGGAIISTASDFTVPDSVKAVVVVTAGNVVFRPVSGGSDITITGAPAGFIIPWHIGVIRSSGTTAALASIADS